MLRIYSDFFADVFEMRFSNRVFPTLSWCSRYFFVYLQLDIYKQREGKSSTTACGGAWIVQGFTFKNLTPLIKKKNGK